MIGTASMKRLKRRNTPNSERFAPSPYSLQKAAKGADIYSWFSIIIFGFGNLARRQFTKGVIFLVTEIAVIYFLATTGVEYLPKITTLGTLKATKIKIRGFWHYTEGDSSVEILLYCVMSLAAICLLIFLATLSLRSAYKAQDTVAKGKKPANFYEDLKSLLDQNAHVGFMTIPTIGIVLFTILPLIFMISMAFTNYDSKHVPLFSWVGLQNFFDIGNSNSLITVSYTHLTLPTICSV